MIPSWPHLVYSLYGAYRLARADTGGMAYFDRTVDGFWKSFFAAVIIAPGYAIVIWGDMPVTAQDASLLRIVAVHLCAYVLSWVAYPVIAHAVCTSIDRQEEFIPFIVATNWAKVIQMVIYLPVIVIVTLKFLPTGGAAFLQAVAYLAVLVYQWFVTRTALAIGGAAAVGFVVLDLIISIFVRAYAIGLLS